MTERQITAIFMGHMADAGVTTPSHTGRRMDHLAHRSMARAPAETTAAADDLVAFDAGVIAGGYVGELGRTHVGGRAVSTSTLGSPAWTELVGSTARCLPPGGAASADLLAAYEAAAVPRHRCPWPVAWGSASTSACRRPASAHGRAPSLEAGHGVGA